MEITKPTLLLSKEIALRNIQNMVRKAISLLSNRVGFVISISG